MRRLKRRRQGRIRPGRSTLIVLRIKKRGAFTGDFEGEKDAIKY
jgi:hypothetical protein